MNVSHGRKNFTANLDIIVNNLSYEAQTKELLGRLFTEWLADC